MTMLSPRHFPLIFLTLTYLPACGMPRQDIQQQLEKADREWQSGSRYNAAKEYEFLYGVDVLSVEEKTRILPRIVEMQLAERSQDEAKKWVKRGVVEGLEVTYTSRTARELLTIVKREHIEDEEARKLGWEAMAELDRKREREKMRATVTSPSGVRVDQGMARDRLTQREIEEIFERMGVGKQK